MGLSFVARRVLYAAGVVAALQAALLVVVMRRGGAARDMLRRFASEGDDAGCAAGGRDPAGLRAYEVVLDADQAATEPVLRLFSTPGALELAKDAAEGRVQAVLLGGAVVGVRPSADAAPAGRVLLKTAAPATTSILMPMQSVAFAEADGIHPALSRTAPSVPRVAVAIGIPWRF